MVADGSYGGYGWGAGAGLVGLGLGYGLAAGYGYPYGYGDPDAGYYGGGYDPGYAYGPGVYAQPQATETAPLVTGRSVSTGGIGGSCATPVKTCALIQPANIGAGCSCRVRGGRSSGSVTP